MNIKEILITQISYLLNPQKRELISISKSFNNQSGIEIGGPSSFFKLKGPLPIYLNAKNIDGVNFSNSTIWEGELLQGNTYTYYEDKIGKQYIAEGDNLSFIDNNCYDFLLSCHSLEHIANPLKALNEWNRVLIPKGKLVLILPNKECTFDRKRPITSFEHLIEDLKNNIDESDSTHFEEIVNMHDLDLDSIKSKQELKKRILDNFTFRSAHHHVFDFNLIDQMLKYAGFKVEFQKTYPPFHLVTIATKL